MAYVPVDSVLDFGVSIVFNSVPTTITTLSGYTGATPFTFTPVTSAGVTSADILTNYVVVWFFGDNNYSLSYSPTHTYNWPGQYEVKIAIFNNNTYVLAASSNTYGGQLSSFKVTYSGVDYNIAINGVQSLKTISKTITAVNYLQDSINWDYTLWNDLSAGQPLSGAVFHGYQSCKSGNTSGPIPLTINYVTPSVTNGQVMFTFYADNSLSQPAVEIIPNQYTNLRPQWRFSLPTSDPTAEGTAMTTYVPSSGVFIAIDPFGNLVTPNDPQAGTIVGLSGSISFFYIDDLPSLKTNYTAISTVTLSATPTVLWVRYDTTSLYNPQEYGNNFTQYSYSNSQITLSSYYYVQSLIPDHLEITLNGNLPVFDTYWPNVESRFFVTVNSAILTGGQMYMSDKNLLNYPINSYSNVGNTFNVYLSSVSTGIQGASAVFNTGLSSLTFNMSRYDASNRDTGGFYRASFTPMLPGSSVLYATTDTGGFLYLIEPPPDPVSGFNPLTRSLSSYNITSPLLIGQSPIFNIVSFDGTYFAHKFNESFNYSDLLKSYALQPTINQNTVFFDNYLGAVAGTDTDTSENYGTVVYEKTANFVNNSSDPIKSNIDQLYSLSEMINTEFDNFNIDSPAVIKRVIDLYSIPQSVLWGSRNTFNRNFANKTFHTNIGSTPYTYDIPTAMVSAGQLIVAQDLFNTQYFELIEVPTITSYNSVTARNMQTYLPTSAYPISAYPLTNYPLSAFFGWGLAVPVINNYRFYIYVPGTDGLQGEGVINWDDPITTLSENVSGTDAWIQDGGILEKIFNYYLHKGLKLIN